MKAITPVRYFKLANLQITRGLRFFIQTLVKIEETKVVIVGGSGIEKKDDFQILENLDHFRLTDRVHKTSGGRQKVIQRRLDRMCQTIR